jgi:hypothetical protein
MNTIALPTKLWDSPLVAIIGETIIDLKLDMVLTLHVTCCVAHMPKIHVDFDASLGLSKSQLEKKIDELL